VPVVEGLSLQLSRLSISSLAFLCALSVASCTPPPAPKQSAKNEVAVGPYHAPKTAAAKKNSPEKKIEEPKAPEHQAPVAQAKAVPVTSSPQLPLPRTEEVNAMRQLEGDLEAKKTEIARENEVRGRLNSALDILKPENVAAASSASSIAPPTNSALTVPITVPEKSSASAATVQAENPFGHPSPKLPLPQDARLEAGKSLRTNEIVTHRPADEKKPAGLDAQARAKLNDKAAVKDKKMISLTGTPFLLEALFISIVLICLVGAMWYRLTHDFGGPRRRRDS